MWPSDVSVITTVLRQFIIAGHKAKERDMNFLLRGQNEQKRPQGRIQRADNEQIRGKE